ncbi:DUF1987 domain-containing protein [uncultured Aquitalea sp.]|uniref:DUF1987 domain-containing protein n=1 Tax=uncultured Aquitalea sp. TaxID=540272 RepID=UPI0025EE570C|nr:DUF1987 domain-containing protein [uncultured Aquitalea sp.]
MQNLYIAATSSTPEVDFRFDSHQLSLRGESYPENAHAFFGPIMDAVQAYLPKLHATTVTLDIQLAYFNSSSTKVLLELFGLFNKAAVAGNYVHLNWHYIEDDETILEFGEEVADDYTALDFHPCAMVG